MKTTQNPYHFNKSSDYIDNPLLSIRQGLQNPGVLTTNEPHFQCSKPTHGHKRERKDSCLTQSARLKIKKKRQTGLYRLISDSIEGKGGGSDGGGSDSLSHQTQTSLSTKFPPNPISAQTQISWGSVTFKRVRFGPFKPGAQNIIYLHQWPSYLSHIYQFAPHSYDEKFL